MPNPPFIARYISEQPYNYTVTDHNHNSHVLNLEKENIVLVEQVSNSLPKKYGIKNSINDTLEYLDATSFDKEVMLPNSSEIFNIRDKRKVVNRYNTNPLNEKPLDTLLKVNDVNLAKDSCIVEYLQVTDPHGHNYTLINIKDCYWQ